MPPSRLQMKRAVDGRVEAERAQDRAGRAASASLSREEAERNFFFRQGDEEHLFETGQRSVKAWQGRHEEDVLLERVQARLKPVASIVNNGLNLNVLEDEGLSFTIGLNEWHVPILTLTAEPDVTLLTLLKRRDAEERRLVASWVDDEVSMRELSQRRVRRYIVPGGFDISSQLAPVNVLESALLYGYPLDLAGSSWEGPSTNLWPTW